MSQSRRIGLRLKKKLISYTKLKEMHFEWDESNIFIREGENQLFL